MDSFSEFLKNQGSRGSSNLSGMPSFSDFLKTSPLIQSKPSFFNRALNATTNTLTNFGQKINDYTNVSTDLVPAFGNKIVEAIKHPIQTTQKVFSQFSEPLISGEQKAGEALYGLATTLKPTATGTGIVDLTNPEIIAHTANLISGLAESAFSPLTGLFKIAEKTPVLKNVADAINVPFTATGLAGSFATGKVIDWIPESILSKESKDIIKAPLQNVVSLAAQVYLGGKIMDKVSEFAKEGKPITPEDAQTIVDNLPPPPDGGGGGPISTSTPLPTFSEFLNQREGSGTRVPSNSTSVYKEPGALAQEPSFQTSIVKSEGFLGSNDNRYTSPSHLMNLNDLSIQDKISTIRENSQRSVEPLSVDIQKATGIRPEIRVKSESSLASKISRYEQKGRLASEISDGLAGKIETRFEDINTQIDNIKKNFKVLESENYFKEPNDWGYKGVNIRIELPNGLPAEIQIHTPESWKATQAIHKLYEKWRDIDPSKLTQEQIDARLADRQQSLKISEEVNPSQKTSGVALSIEQNTIEKGLTKDLGGLAGYDPITIKEQSRLVAELMKSNLEDAKKMIKGEMNLPDNLRGAALIKGMEDYAISKGDISLLKDLADSPLVSETSRHAQELRLLAERNPESPVSIMKAVKDARERAVETKTGKKVSQQKKEIINEIKTEMKKNKPTRQSWESFIENIKCNY